MDLQTLQFFCTAATEGSLTKAAQKMNYAQSNLSTRMHALEEELGVTLFQRSAGGIRLTPKGEVLYLTGADATSGTTPVAFTAPVK